MLAGHVRCLNELGLWEDLHHIVERQWNRIVKFPDSLLNDVAKGACAAALALREWSALENYLPHVGAGSLDSSFYRALHAIHLDKSTEAAKYIAECRSLLDVQLSIVLSENYERAYSQVVQVQLLSEMEEIMVYKRQSERRQDIRHMWRKRLLGAKADPNVWLKVLNLRSMVLEPQDDIDSAIELSRLSLKASNFALSEKVLQRLLEPNDSVTPQISISNPHVCFAYLKHRWSTGDTSALKALQEFVGSQTWTVNDVKLRAKAYHQLGEWMRDQQEEEPEDASITRDKIIETLHLATELDPQLYEAWQSWAFMNLEQLAEDEEKSNSRPSSIRRRRAVSEAIGVKTPPKRKPAPKTSNNQVKYAVNAVNGFFRCISLNPENSLQDSLRLLSVWFKHGSSGVVNAAVANGRAAVSLDTWLKNIPQFIARLDISNVTVRHSIKQVRSTSTHVTHPAQWLGAP